jgi:hypothetical protein
MVFAASIKRVQLFFRVVLSNDNLSPLRAVLPALQHFLVAFTPPFMRYVGFGSNVHFFLNVDILIF